MKNITLAFFLIFSATMLRAQYYYKDLIGTRDLNHLIRLYNQNKVKLVEAAGYDGNGLQSGDFSEEHEFLPDHNLLKISTRNKTDSTDEYYRYNGNGLVATISDTSSSLISTTSYEYDGNNNPITIKNVVNDANDSVYENEVHVWFYNAQGKPVKMLRIVNINDTTDIHFTLDSRGNVIEELPFVRNVSGEKTYYYYDQENRLTDIVRFNTKARRLLPDYMFEYSDNNQVSQKITTLSAGGTGYLIWRYAYDARGLRTTEASFNRDKDLTGKIKYSYLFAQ